MSAPQPGALAQDPAGLLTSKGRRLPWALLARLRPLQLATFARRLQDYRRTGEGLRLIESLFPEALAGYTDLAGTGWWELVAHLANLVEAQAWFEIDWPALNDAWACWMEEPEENGDQLAWFLRFIPVRLYGFSQQSILEFPAMELLRVLLADGAGAVSSELLISAELYDGLEGWTAADRAAVWERLHRIEADPGRYPAPVRWLPELARYACGRTGNPLLDNELDPAGQGPWFSWTADLEQVRTAWRRARPVLEQFHNLITWSEADNSRLATLAHCLMEDTSYDHLEW